jgi:asparagine synthase (glutamine-hydrolysing)
MLDYSKMSKSRQTEAEHIADIKTILDEAVKIRMISNVPLGAFLSGGIDSSAVVALMQKHALRPVKTFSVVFQERKYDERNFSAQVAEKFKTEHTQLLLKEKDILKEIPHIFDSMDQPSVDGFNTFVISKAVKNAGLTVALSGLGGDELFAGYQLFKILPRLAQIVAYTKHIPAKQQLFSIFSRFVKNRHLEKGFFSVLQCRDIYDLHNLQRMIFFPEEINKIITLGTEQSSTPKADEQVDVINLLSYLELTTYLQNTLLQDTDRMSMANSLEVRVPFLDHILIEKMFKIPGGLKVGKDVSKRLLVMAMEGILPEFTYARPKMGFVFPFDNWLRGSLKEFCEDTLAMRNMRNISILNYSKARTIWTDFLRRPKVHNYSSILALLSFVTWYNKNI